MNNKIKLSIMIIAIVLAVTGGVAVIELQKSSNKIMNLAEQKTINLSRQYAQYWDGRMNNCINVLQTLTNIMNSYENLPVENRRRTYEGNMKSVFEDMPDFIRMFIVWKPNAIDGMDARYIGKVGSTSTGQFAFALTRETGNIQPMISQVVDETMSYIIGPDSRTVRISDPSIIKFMGRDTFTVKILVPIINYRLNEPVGAIGCQVDIGFLQPMLMQDIKTNEEISSAVIYCDNGFILASYLPEFIGKQIDSETQYGKYLDDVKTAVKNAREWKGKAYDTELKTNMVIVLVNIPIGVSKTTWSLMFGSTYIVKDVNALKIFVIILTLIALIISVVIICIIINNAMAKTVKVSEPLKNTSEGESDPPKNVAVSSDEKKGNIFCTKCGEKIQENHKFCIKCGHPVDGNNSA